MSRPPRPNNAHSRLLWLLAVLLTLAAVVYQRSIGPTRPVRGKVEVGSQELRYRLPRSHGGRDVCTISISLPDSSLHGWILYRRYKTQDEWTRSSMTWENGRLSGSVPHQPPGGKVAYRVFLSPPATVTEGSSPSISSHMVGVPPAGPVILRFRGGVPAAVMIPHILLMFCGMLWSNRAGIEALRRKPDLHRQAVWSLILLTLGGLVLGPAVQWYSFGKAWTGYPYGTDLTDNKTLIAVLCWILAVGVSLIARRRSAFPPREAGGDAAGHRAGHLQRAFVLLAAVVTLLIFAIPHSVRGTELDYSKVSEPARESGR